MVSQHARLEAATQHQDDPLAAVDLEAFDANALDLVRRSAGLPVRVASKSVRCRALIRRAVETPGFAGVLAFTVTEALWLAEEYEDVVVGYPSAEREALARLGADPVAAERVTVMIDSVEGLELMTSAVPTVAAPLRVCLDLDASLRYGGGRVHLGMRRSPLRTPADAVALARAVAAEPALRLVGLLAYEGQVAGLADRGANPFRTALVRRVKAVSRVELAERRGAVVAAVREVADLEFVNGGGTGSLESTSADPSVTEVAAGSGLFAPALFDGYDAFDLRPAAFVGLTVCRRPAPGLVTVTGGGWVASGPIGRDRLPVPTYPEGLRLLPNEGAGEVQTPLKGGAVADGLALGDRVWFRHAKAGELCERVDALHLVEADGGTADVVPTYRGEGRTFT